jgi:hypothetical protein
MSNDRPPFDTVRAAFYLVAGVITVYALVVLLGVTACLWHLDIILTTDYKCDAENKLADLLNAALAAALAFAGGMMRGPGRGGNDDNDNNDDDNNKP